MAIEQVHADYGLGALPSPPDERDFDIADLYAKTGLASAIALPSAYIVPNRPPILNQGSTPMCVAYSTSAMKSYQDRTDQATAKWWNFDEPRFFSQIGGTSQGAYLRVALDRILKYGYPVYANADTAANHKIRGYYAIPRYDLTAIKTAIKTFGVIVLVMPWYHSWLRSPESSVNYTLPRPDYQIGGHAILADGWDDRFGLRLRNSWGSIWGNNGDAFMPYYYATRVVWEYWKALDV